MARSKWISFVGQQALDRAAAAADSRPKVPPSPTVSSADAKKFGLENFGNTCYANSVLQALYFCTPFRDLVLQAHDPSTSKAAQPPTGQPKPLAPLVPVRRKSERKPSTSGHPAEPAVTLPYAPIPPIPSSPPTLFSALRSLFLYISSHPKERGTVSPRAFIDKVKELNELFRGTMHQDTHEFLMFLLNRIVEEIEEERKELLNGGAKEEDLSSSNATTSSKTPPTVATGSNSGTSPQDATLVHKLFEGVLTSETRCLTCETVSSRDESFLDLSIDIEQNSSVTACLRQFSASEMLCQKNKFFCDACCDLQEAEKRMKIKKLPNVLALHLKRFKYQEDVGRYIKLAYRVAFPMDLRLFNTVDDMDDSDRLYNLFAVVVHIGNGPHHGHYISIIKTHGSWLVFDDDNVSTIPESDIPKYFGDSNSGSAYVLYYQAADIDTVSLGLRSPDPAPLESLSTSASTPLIHPTFHSTPILPPGLDPDNTSSDASDPSFPITPSLGTHLPEFLADKPTLVVAPVTGAVPEQSPFPNSATPTSPTGITKIFNTLRRAPSISVPRGSIGSASAAHGPDIRRSGVERSPRPSSSTPSLTADDVRRSLEPPPPLPPLPPTIHAAAPIPIPQIISGEEKEPSKKSSGGWFRKRKSLRLNDKSRPEDYPASPALPSSPAHVQRGDGPEEAQSSTWFKTFDQSKRDRKRRPSESGLSGPTIDGLHPNRPRPKSTHTGVPVGKHERERHHQPNGYDESPTPSSASSSYNSSSKQPLARATRPSTGASSSSSTSGQHVDQLPPKMSSLTPLSPGRQRPPYDHARQQRESSPSKVNVNHKGSQSPLSFTKSQDYDRNLPPLPPTPQFLSRSSSSYQRNDSNGHAFVAEPDGTVLEGDDLGNGSVFMASMATPMSQPSVPPATFPPLSMANSFGVNTSTGSSSSASAVSGIRLARRKLSFTTPMLGFGRKDKDKDKKS